MPARMFYSLTPPQVPDDLQALERAIMQLGHLAKGSVKQKVLRDLETLLGELPHPDVVVEWKTALKKHRKELVSNLQARGEDL